MTRPAEEVLRLCVHAPPGPMDWDRQYKHAAVGACLLQPRPLTVCQAARYRAHCQRRDTPISLR